MVNCTGVIFHIYGTAFAVTRGTALQQVIASSFNADVDELLRGFSRVKRGLDAQLKVLDTVRGFGDIAALKMTIEGFSNEVNGVWFFLFFWANQ
jgi:hypothetical protein